VSDFEPDVPEHPEDFLHGRGLLRRGLASGVQEHDVDVAEGIHLAPSVATERGNDETVGLCLADGLFADLREEPAEKDVDKIAALSHDLASARARRNAQTQPVFLETFESLVGGERIRRAFALGLAVEIVARPLEDFFQVVTHARAVLLPPPVGPENDNFHAAVELLLLDRAIGRRKRLGAAQSARVDARGIDAHGLR